MDGISVPVDTWELAGRLTTATILGALVGLNRERAGKPAGLRTHALVSLGGALATMTGMLFAGAIGDTSATGRVVQGLFAGIGFLGGGVILRDLNAREVHGLTTAASIWVVSAIGIAVGAGLWRTAAIAAGLTLLVLAVGGKIDRLVRDPENRTRDHD